MKKDSVGLVGRSGCQLELQFENNISITTNSKKENSETANISLSESQNSIRLNSKEIVLESQDNTNQEYSMVYGERLIELLKWIIQTLKTHSHPPNAAPIPDFFQEADKWTRRLESYLLNDNIRHK